MKKVFILIISLIYFVSGCSCNLTNLLNNEISKASIISSYIRGYIDKNKENYIVVSPFGTYVNISTYDGIKISSLQKTLDVNAFKYHSLLDRYYYYEDENGNIINNIKVINDSYGTGSSIKVDEIIIEILKEGIKYSKLSNGSFNIISGAIIDVWNSRFDDVNRVDPSKEEIEEALKCVANISNIDEILIIDDLNNMVTFNSFNGCQSKASIDLGALAKSYFLDKLVNLEEFKQLDTASYDAGESSIIVRGINPSRKSGAWHIALKDNLEGGYALQLQLKEDSAISTSSSYNKSYINEFGVKRHHIIDATSGYPNNYLLSATVVCESAMIADIITTTLMSFKNLDKIKSYLSSLKINGLRVLLQIEENGTLKVLVNDNMKGIIKDISEDSILVIEEFNYGA